LAREVIVRFVDIDDIVDYHCFKLHIIITKNQSLWQIVIMSLVVHLLNNNTSNWKDIMNYYYTTIIIFFETLKKG
jgi:hypothetical protein